jgi:PRC-barrel domain
MTEQATGPAAAEAIVGWVGARLDDMSGAGVGKVEGLYVDAQGGDPAWLLVRVGRFGRHSLVPARDAVAGGGHVWVPYGREVLRGVPRVEPGQPLDAEREREVSSHYRTARAAELAGRPEGAPTSRPAG